MNIIYLTGPTCAGKGTLVEVIQNRFGNAAGIVQVGKVLREMYDASYFNGQANPAHVAAEALELHDELLTKELERDWLDFIIVDGQPRQSQVAHILRFHEDWINDIFFLHLDASVAVRRARVEQRFPVQSASRQLALARINNDRLTYYDTLVEMLRAEVQVDVMNTESDIKVWTEQAIEYITGG